VSGLDVLAIIIASGGAAAAWIHVRFGWSAAQRTRRLLRRTRVQPIAQVPDGKLACVVGRVELAAERTLRSLATQRDCVAYETKIYVEWAGIVEVTVRRLAVPFFVVDASGRALVDAQEAALSNRPVARSALCVERVIEPGMRVRLVGSVVRAPIIDHAAEVGFRDGATDVTITGTAKYPLLVDSED
jgi:hypothetical protein